MAGHIRIMTVREARSFTAGLLVLADPHFDRKTITRSDVRLIARLVLSLLAGRGEDSIIEIDMDTEGDRT